MLTFNLTSVFYFFNTNLVTIYYNLDFISRFKFIPSLIGFGNANPTEFPHLTRVASNVTIVNEILFQHPHMLLFITFTNT